MSDLRRQEGFTLPEMLTSLVIGMIVLVAAFGLMLFTVKRAGEVTGRVEAAQKGRGAMDIMTQHLRSQVCLNSTTPPIVTGTANSVTFYVDLSNSTLVDPAPERQVITYDPATRRLNEEDYKGTRVGETVTYKAAPDRRRVLSENVVPETAGAPIFRYYAYDTSTPPRPTVALGAPLNDDDRARTVKMEVAFRVLPPRTQTTATTARGDVLLRDEIYVRAADPDDPRDVRTPDSDDPVPPVCA